LGIRRDYTANKYGRGDLAPLGRRTPPFLWITFVRRDASIRYCGGEITSPLQDEQYYETFGDPHIWMRGIMGFGYRMDIGWSKEERRKRLGQIAIYGGLICV